MIIQDKTILVTGANGLVGIPCIQQLLSKLPKKVIAVDKIIGEDLKSLQQKHTSLEIRQLDLIYLNLVEDIFRHNEIDIVIHLAGIKGSPSRTAKCPADYVFPMLQFNTNVIQASFRAGVKWFIYTSSVGVYAPAELMIEDSVWETFPSKNDWHPGWTKRMGELALDALKIQYGWDNWTILRPANIYGRHDNFSPDATVIASNIYKIFNTIENNIVCWGDGSPRRDFVYADDVAGAALASIEKEVKDVMNVGSNQAVSIKETIEIIVDSFTAIHGERKLINWDTSKPNGDMFRRLDSSKQIKYDILPKISLSEGIKQSMQYYKEKLCKI